MFLTVIKFYSSNFVLIYPATHLLILKRYCIGFIRVLMCLRIVLFENDPFKIHQSELSYKIDGT